MFPHYEAKQNMLICITEWNASMSEQQKTHALQQAQIMRGNCFLRVTLEDFTKTFKRALAQVHTFSRIGSQYEVDRLEAINKARKGEFDKQALERNAHLG